MSIPPPKYDLQPTNPHESTLHPATKDTPDLLLSCTPIPEVKNRLDMDTTDTFIESGE